MKKKTHTDKCSSDKRESNATAVTGWKFPSAKYCRQTAYEFGVNPVPPTVTAKLV